jgi:hypothetical protein
MSCPLPERSDDVTIYLVLNDYGKLGSAYVETDPAEADRKTIICNFLSGRYGNAVRVVAFNTAEGWSWDVSEDIAREILQRALETGKDLAEDTKRFTNPVQTSPVDLIDRLKPNFEKRPAAPSVRRKAIPAAGRKRS